MYIHDTSPQIQLAGLGKFKLKKLFKAPKKILRAVVRPVRKVVKQLPKAVKKLAPVAALAAGAYWLGPALSAKVAGQALSARLSRGGAGAPLEYPPEATPPFYPPSPDAREAIAQAASQYFASRLPRPTPSQSSSPYPEADEADYEQPAGPAPRARGDALGDLKVPLIAAAIAVPLLVVAAGSGRRR